MRLICLFAALALTPLPALAANANGAASATVVKPIAVRQISDLDFGVIAANGRSAGSVTITPGRSAADYSGGARTACHSQARCPAPHVAQFEVTGEAGRAYSISAPARLSVEENPQGAGRAEPMLVVDAIQLRSASRPGAGSAGRLDSAGIDRFDLGGTLRVPAATPPAHFRLSVEVIVTYS